MKITQVIIALIFAGVAYFFIDLWLYDPFDSKVKLPVEVDSIEFMDPIKVRAELSSDSVLERDIQQLESEFQATVKNSRSMAVIDEAAANSEKHVMKSKTMSPWRLVDKSILTQEIRLRESIDPVQLVQIDSNVLRSLKVNDQLDFPAINGKQYTVNVLKTKTLWNGDISIRGVIQADDGNRFPAIISSGKNATFASFSTPEGSFELEAFGNIGGLYSVNEMDKQAYYPKTDELLN